MKRLWTALGLMALLAGCGAEPPKAVQADPAVLDEPVVAKPVTLRQPDPDVRRGLAGGSGVDCGRMKCVALTFDDGPMDDTPRLLKMLDEYHAKATFFVVGQMVQQFPQIVRQEVQAGHEIGNHSWNHSDLAHLSADGVRAQIDKTQQAVQQAAGVRPTLLRPPYGSTDKEVSAIAASEGLPEILWQVDPTDWRDRDASIVGRRVLSQTRPGAVVLMHDIHPTSVDAVPRILKTLADRGYRFVTVSTLFAGTDLQPGHQYTERPADVGR